MKKKQNQIIALRDSLFLIKSIEQRILWIRNQKVILDADLAEMFGISTKRFNEQVKRNLGRFPEDFLFTLSMREKQEVVAFCDHLHKLKFSAALPKALNQAVKRNQSRFPEDFWFQLAKQEMQDWRSQFVTSNRGKIGISRNLNNVPVLYGYEE